MEASSDFSIRPAESSGRDCRAGEVAWVGQTDAGPLVVIYRPGEPLFLVDGAGKVRRMPVPFGPHDGALAVSRDGTLLAAAWGPRGGESRLELSRFAVG